MRGDVGVVVVFVEEGLLFWDSWGWWWWGGVLFMFLFFVY